jgi:hypothetical protein
MALSPDLGRKKPGPPSCEKKESVSGQNCSFRELRVCV